MRLSNADCVCIQGRNFVPKSKGYQFLFRSGFGGRRNRGGVRGLGFPSKPPPHRGRGLERRLYPHSKFQKVGGRRTPRIPWKLRLCTCMYIWLLWLWSQTTTENLMPLHVAGDFYTPRLPTTKPWLRHCSNPTFNHSFELPSCTLELGLDENENVLYCVVGANLYNELHYFVVAILVVFL